MKNIQSINTPRYRHNWLIITHIPLALLMRTAVFICLYGLFFGSPATAQEQASGLLTVQALLDDKSCTFILDTGASVHAISSLHSKHLKERIGFGEISTIGGSVQQQVFRIDTLQINDASITVSASIQIDAERLSHLAGDHVDGILGCLALQSGSVRIIDGKAAEFLPNDVRLPDTTDDFHISFDQHGRPFLSEVSLAGSRQFMLIDTGFRGSVSLSAVVFNGLLHSEEIEDVSMTRVETIHGVADVRSGRLSLLKLGDMEFRDVPVIEGHENSLGLDFFKGAEVVIDFKRYAFLVLKRTKSWKRSGPPSSD